MCELMGMSFASPIRADFSIREFAMRGLENADGWGLAWYPDQSVAVVKEPRQWQVSPHSGFLESYSNLHATIYLAHVRHKTTGGEPTHADTHPFTREWAGRDYCFAHNGTVASIFQKPLGRFRTLGATDSERLFCWLMERIARRERHLDSEEDWRWLHEQLATLNTGEKLNCLMSDGHRLFCYFDENGHKGLTFRPVLLCDETRSFGDPTVAVQVGDKRLNCGVVVASNPLSSTGWECFKPGEMIVLARGDRVFSSRQGDACNPAPVPSC